ncbi:nuclease-like [Drosophila obscura]|uniref:nuclease-like n=1 Tax=Drosophila obscura TaxID=7282 RepID=UPI001BB1908D|nr:nuclease-like [Drosophila obscura]
MSDPQQRFAMCVLFGVSGLLCGAFVQHELSIMKLLEAIKRDPYVYHYRRRLYPLLSTFSTDHEGRLWNRSVGLRDKLCQLLVPRLYNALLPRPMPVEESSPSVANMLDLIKYGLPSADNLVVHRDCIMSQRTKMSSARWIIEHFRASPSADESVSVSGSESESDSGDDFHRYSDAFLLGDNSAEMGKVFKRRIWRELEQYVRLKTQECGSVYCYTGPIYMPMGNGTTWWVEYKKSDSVATPIPTHYFKVLILESKVAGQEPTIKAYIVRNGGRGGGSFRDRRHRIEDIERYTGLSFSKDLQPTVLYDDDNGTIQIDLACENDIQSFVAAPIE